jgi:hypothetical protein
MKHPVTIRTDDDEVLDACHLAALIIGRQRNRVMDLSILLAVDFLEVETANRTAQPSCSIAIALSGGIGGVATNSS